MLYSRHDLSHGARQQDSKWESKAVAPKRSTGQRATPKKKEFTGFTDIFNPKRLKVAEPIVIDDDPTLPIDMSDLPEPFSPVTDDFGMPTSYLHQQNPLDVSTSSDGSGIDFINRSISSTSSSAYKFTPPTSGQPVASNSSRLFKSSTSSVPSRHQILSNESTPSSQNASVFGADTSCDSDVAPSGLPSIRKPDFDEFGDSLNLFGNNKPSIVPEESPQVILNLQARSELVKLHEAFAKRKALCVKARSIKDRRAAMLEKIAAMDKEVGILDDAVFVLDKSIGEMSDSFSKRRL
jgi:hypothetical protein